VGIRVSQEPESRHDEVVTSVVRHALIVALVSVTGCTMGADSAAPPSLSSVTVSALSPHAPATVSGTFVSVGGIQTSPIPLRGCISVTSAISQVSPRCVQVDPDGKWSVTVRPGTYDVSGTPEGNGGKDRCGPDHNPIQVRAGEQVVVDVVCYLP